MQSLIKIYKRLLVVITLGVLVVAGGLIYDIHFSKIFFGNKPFNLAKAVDSDRLFLEDQTQVTQTGIYIFNSLDNIGMKGSKIELAYQDGSFRKTIAESNSISYYTTPILNITEDKFVYFRIFPMEIWVYNLKTNEEEMIYADWNLGEGEKNIFNPPIGYEGKILNVYWDELDNIYFMDMATLPHNQYKIDSTNGDIELVDSIKFDPKPNSALIKKLDIVKYSQNDSKWSGEQLGTCDDETIGSAGCTITAIAMLLDYYSSDDLTPEEVNKRLQDHDSMGYVGCAVIWSMIPNLTQNVALKYMGFNIYDTARLDYELSLGNPVIVGFDNVNFSNIPHWVLVVGKNTDGEYITNDPWTGEEKLISYFGTQFNHMMVYEKYEEVDVL